MRVFNYRYPITKKFKLDVPLIGDLHDCTLIMWQIGQGEPIMIKNFVIDTCTCTWLYDYVFNQTTPTLTPTGGQMLS